MWAHDTPFQHELLSWFNLDTELRQWLSQHSHLQSQGAVTIKLLKVNCTWKCWSVMDVNHHRHTEVSETWAWGMCSHWEASFSPCDALSSAELVSSSHVQSRRSVTESLHTFTAIPQQQRAGLRVCGGREILLARLTSPTQPHTYVGQTSFPEKIFPWGALYWMFSPLTSGWVLHWGRSWDVSNFVMCMYNTIDFKLSQFSNTKLIVFKLGFF